jgi:hypothetical protein
MAPRTPVVPAWVFAAIVIVAVVAAYGGGVGRGFIKEDASWVLHSRLARLPDAPRLLTRTSGFFRPVVAYSFAVNHWMFGSRPAGYGWTNLLLALGGSAAIAAFARALGLPSGAALLAGAVWILNFHGINMAVLWLSGRTSLLLTLFAALAAIASARGRLVPACICALLAMGSKEEGVLLPFILCAVLWLRPEGLPDRRRTAAFVVAIFGVLALYGVLRMRSDAFTVVNAPAFYRLTGPDWSLTKNIAEYADRALTLPLAVTVLAFALARRLPRLDRTEWRLIALGAVWVAFGFGVTLLLTTRSSLYAVFPSVGSALACTVVVRGMWDRASAGGQRAMTIAALVVPLALVPVYWQRNVRWTELADVSRQLVAELAGLAPSAPPQWSVIVVDDRTTRANVAAASGWGLPDAVELTTGRRPRLWIAPPPPDLTEAEWVMAPASADAILALRAGRIVRVPIDEWTRTMAGELR